MKYLDVIAKTFATTVSLFIVAFVSIAYLGETVRPELFLGAIVAAIAIEGYYHGPGLIDEDPNFVESVGGGGGGGGAELKSDFTLGEEDDEGGEMKTSASKDAVV